MTFAKSIKNITCSFWGVKGIVKVGYEFIKFFFARRRISKTTLVRVEYPVLV